jgi:hypothetical protein
LTVTQLRNYELQLRGITGTRTYFLNMVRLPAVLDHYSQRVARGAAVAQLLEDIRRVGFAPDTAERQD